MLLAERRRLRLVLRDFAALAAGVSVALSGVVPIPALAIFGLAWLVSLAGRRPLAGRRGWAAFVLLAAAVALFGLAFLGTLDLIIAAVSFALLVVAHRLLSEASVTTDRQVLLASLLLLAGGAALSGEFWFALCALAFGIFACLQLGLTAIEGPVEREQALPVGLVARQLGAGLSWCLVGAVAFFFLFPRMSWNVAARRTPPGVLGGTTGMSDRVSLGGGGSIKSSARVVARVRLEPDPGREQLEQYWEGRNFDAFDGKEWRGSGVPGPERASIFIERRARSQMLVQRFELTAAYGARTLIARESAQMFSDAKLLTPTGPRTVGLIRLPDEEVRFAVDAPAYSYTATSTDAFEGGALASVDPKYLEVPAGLDPRVRELATRLRGDAQSPAQIAARLESQLKRGYAYSLEQGAPTDDPLASFLFVRKAGHCEHFATALAIMLRVSGVPARVTAGFFGGERLTAYYALRAGDAHAWVQAFIPGRGWQRFDATPEEGRGPQSASFVSLAVDAYERLESWWRARVVDYSLNDQVDFVRGLVRPPASVVKDGEQADQAPASSRAKWPWAAAAAALVFVALRAALRRASRRPHQAARFLDRLERALETAAIRRLPGEQVEELARRLSAEAHPVAPQVRRAVRRYLEARFSGAPLPADEQRQLLAPLEKRLQDGARPH